MSRATTFPDNTREDLKRVTKFSLCFPFYLTVKIIQAQNCSFGDYRKVIAFTVFALKRSFKAFGRHTQAAVSLRSMIQFRLFAVLSETVVDWDISLFIHSFVWFRKVTFCDKRVCRLCFSSNLSPERLILFCVVLFSLDCVCSCILFVFNWSFLYMCSECKLIWELRGTLVLRNLRLAYSVRLQQFMPSALQFENSIKLSRFQADDSVFPLNV